MLRGVHALIDTTTTCPRSKWTKLLRYGPAPKCYTTLAEPTHNIAVLGGGITGLACAYYLTHELPRARVTIYEASDRIGGWLSSNRVEVHDGTVLFETGPRTLRPTTNGLLSARLVQDLGLAKDGIFPQKSSPAARNRYVYYPDHLVRMPHPSYGLAENLWSLLTEPVFSGTLSGALLEPFRDARDKSLKDESVGAFLTRRIGRNTVDRIVSAVLHGIYAGDVWQLSAKSLFSGAWRDEGIEGSVFAGMMKRARSVPALLSGRGGEIEVPKRDADFMMEMKDYKWDNLLKATLNGSTVFTFKEGLQTLVDALVRSLVEQGNVEFRTSTPVQSITLTEDSSNIRVTHQNEDLGSTYSHVISALSPVHLDEVAKTGARALVPPIPAVTVMTVNLYYRTPHLNPPGFGYLIPQATPFDNNPERALGVIFDTAYSPSPQDLDLNNWHVNDADQLRKAREQGQLINVNDFGWYNMPERPNMQDYVRKRGTKLTVMLGGHWWNDWPAFPDEQEGLTLARSVLQRHLGITEEPEVGRVNVQRDCIPQYTVGHEARLKTAHDNIAREYKGRLRVAGNWMSGVGVNDCLRSAWDVVRNLRKGCDGTGLEHVGGEEYVKMRQMLPGEEREE
jgi:protoporphyrinogen/coproporphyrinogen III oxidase